MDEKAFGKLLAYSPMYHARLFRETKHFRDKHFQPTRANALNSSTAANESAGSHPYLDGRTDLDRPLTVQFCANDPDEFLEAAKFVQPYCDAVDLNLGCPQGIARKGRYGAFLQEDQELIYRLINKLHIQLDVPVTAKIRMLDSKEATLAYAENILSAGASILTVHGRMREQKGHNTGLADWSTIRYLRENLPRETVLFANGNILRHEDIARCLEATGADGVMSAEGNLHDPTIFAPRPTHPPDDASYWRSSITSRGGYRVDYVFRRYMSIIYKHVLEEPEPKRPPLFDPSNPSTDEPIIHNPYSLDEDGPPRKKQKKNGKSTLSPSVAVMQGHLFSLLRPLVSANTNVRDALAKARPGHMATFEYVLALTEQAVRRGLEEYTRDPTKYEEIEANDGNLADSPPSDLTDHESSILAVKACKMPWWVCQSYVRPLPKEALEKGAIKPSKKQRKQIEEDAKASEFTVKDVKAKSLEAISESKGEENPSAQEETPQPAMVCG
jgi:tRNA-dihydrouridine synthase 1